MVRTIVRRLALVLASTLALLGAAAAWVGEAAVALIIGAVALFGFALAALARRASAVGDAAFDAALESLAQLAADRRALRKLEAAWLQAASHAARLGELREHGDRESNARAAEAVGAMVDASFSAKLRRKVSYAVVDRMLDAVSGVALLDDAAEGPLVRCMDRYLWVEMPGEPLSVRAEVLKRGIPPGPLRSKPFDAPVFKRMVREG